MKKNVFKIMTGSRGEIEFVGDFQIEGSLKEWCENYFEGEKADMFDVLDYNEENEEDKEGIKGYVEDFFNMVEVGEGEGYSMGLGEERMEYYIDMDSEMFGERVKMWKEELGVVGDWSDVSEDLIWDFIYALDDLSW